MLTNAYKYGGDPVKVSVTVEEQPSYVKVKVTDNGAGIPAVEQQTGRRLAGLVAVFAEAADCPVVTRADSIQAGECRPH